MSDAVDTRTPPDDESSTGADRSTIHQAGNPLSRGERAACAVVGLTGGAAGAVGVFVDGTNAGGVPVLLGLGAFFGYMAVSGQRLSHIKVGNNEASFIGRILRDPKISDDAKLEVAEHLEENLDLPPAAQRVVSEVLDSRAVAAEYEQQVVAAIERVAGPAIAERRVLGRQAYDWDLLLRADRGSAVAVEIKWRNRAISQVELRQMLRLVAEYSSEPVGVLVTSQPVIPGSRYATIGPAGDILWLAVSWNGPGDDTNLKAALDQALERAE
jgi:hypothetical protein